MGPRISTPASHGEATDTTTTEETPTPEPGSQPARSRRALLAAGLGAAGAFVASAIGRPAPADAASVVLGATNNETAATRFHNTAASSSAVGVVGRTTYAGAASSARGVVGLSDGIGGIGVVGEANTGVGARGVLGTSSSGTGVRGISTASNAVGVHGTSTNGSSAKGVQGTSTTGIGVYGEATSTGSTNYGVYGSSAGASGRGVYGRSLNASSGVGVYGLCVGNGAAVQGYAQGPGFGYAVSALSEKSTGVIGSSLVSSGFAAGVYGNSYSADGTGVYGDNTYGGTGVWAHTYNGTALYASANYAPGDFAYAGWFEGATHVNGTLSKTSGTFLIDHPLDPANKTLAHSFVEAPEMLNVYRGNVTLDAKGRATVKLPSYFHALNESFSYQLTAIGGPAPDLHVASKIVKGSFDIAGGAAGQEIAWQVTGARADAWAKANPLEVEKQKRTADRGKYLNPEAHGKPAAEGVNYQPTPKAQVAPKG
jgi:hypothetical protein